MSTIPPSALSSIVPVTVAAATALSTRPLVNPSHLGIDIQEAFIGAGLAFAYAYMAPASLLGHIVTPIAGAVLGAFGGSVADHVASRVHQCYFSRYYKPYILTPEISRILAPLKTAESIDIDRVLDEERDLMQRAFFSQIVQLPGFRQWAERNKLATPNDAFMHLQTCWRVGTCLGENQEIIKKILAAPQRPLPQILRSIDITDILVSQTKHKCEVSARLDKALPHPTASQIGQERSEFSSELNHAVRGAAIQEAKTCSFTINRITADTIHELLRPLDHTSATKPSPVIISVKMLWGMTPEIAETVESTFGAERAKLLEGGLGHIMLLYRNCGDPTSPIYLYNSERPYHGCFEFRDLETCSKMLYALAKHRVGDIEDLDRLDITLESNTAALR